MAKCVGLVTTSVARGTSRITAPLTQLAGQLANPPLDRRIAFLALDLIFQLVARHAQGHLEADRAARDNRRRRRYESGGDHQAQTQRQFPGLNGGAGQGLLIERGQANEAALEEQRRQHADGRRLGDGRAAAQQCRPREQAAQARCIGSTRSQLGDARAGTMRKPACPTIAASAVTNRTPSNSPITCKPRVRNSVSNSRVRSGPSSWMRLRACRDAPLPTGWRRWSATRTTTRRWRPATTVPPSTPC